jgi:hypothetical protein
VTDGASRGFASPVKKTRKSPSITVTYTPSANKTLTRRQTATTIFARKRFGIARAKSFSRLFVLQAFDIAQNRKIAIWNNLDFQRRAEVCEARRCRDVT